MADTNTQREVVVECFAPYDDHRWVNIGKERDGMAPDAVQVIEMCKIRTEHRATTINPIWQKKIFGGFDIGGKQTLLLWVQMT